MNNKASSSSSRRGRRRDKGGHDHFSPNFFQENDEAGYCFFKIIHNAIIQDGKLVIPSNFVKKYGHDFSNNLAVLRLPNDSAWIIGMKKEDSSGGGGGSTVCFQSGLKEFLEYYSIGSGHFLVFRYEGNSEFHVIICDMSGSEIDYPIHTSDYYTSDDERHTTSTSNHNYDHNNEGSNSKTKEETDHEDEDYAAEISHVFPSIYINGDDDDSSSEEEAAKKKKNKKKKKIAYESRSERAGRANQVAKEFKSKNPFFTVALQSAYINHKYLPIPSTFKAKPLLAKLESIRAVLEVPDGQSWLFGFLSTKDRKDVRLSKGVAAFIDDNNLEVGDVCVFELVKMMSKFEFKVYIFHC